MSGLHKVLEKMLHHIYALQDSKYSSGSEYGRVTPGSEQNSPLWIFDRVLNMPLVWK